MWVLLTEVPHETIEKLVESLQKAEALIDPIGTRKTWGQTEEHLEMSRRAEHRAGSGQPPTENESGPIHRAGPPPGR